MNDSELIRSVRQVGMYRVAWMHGVPEAAEEAITDYLLRHPDMVRSTRINVAWNYWPGDERHRLFRTGYSEDERMAGPILDVSESWWTLTPLDRERAFLEDLLIEQLADDRLLRWTREGDIELLHGEELLSGADALAVVRAWADEVLAGRPKPTL
jgi:hypothetical protein